MGSHFLFFYAVQWVFFVFLLLGSKNRVRVFCFNIGVQLLYTVYFALRFKNEQGEERLSFAIGLFLSITIHAILNIASLVRLLIQDRKKESQDYLTIRSRLFDLLDKAEKLASDFSGGYSSMFDSAEDFHQALQTAIQKLKDGDNSQLTIIHFWFGPTGAWDTFVGINGQDLANEIDATLEQLAKIQL